ncbi:MAG: hypothetical protein NZM33_05695 [Bryobacteraceae bacterium]|nr:hypothetical protein [Bryobacteraceae bacterium]
MRSYSRPVRWLTLTMLALGTTLASRAQSPSLPPEWEVREQLRTLEQGLQRLKSLLNGIRPEDWVSKGAPEAYEAQLRSLDNEIGYLGNSFQRLSEDPERLTLALEVWLRFQAVQALLESLNEGVRRYQNPALADLVRETFAETAPTREKLRGYLVQLAAVKEAELKVMHEEAQRCRTMLLRAPQTRQDPKSNPERR